MISLCFALDFQQLRWISTAAPKAIEASLLTKYLATLKRNMLNACHYTRCESNHVKSQDPGAFSFLAALTKS